MQHNIVLMKSTSLRRYAFFILLLSGLGVQRLKAQTIIGGTTTNPAVILDLQSSAKGLLLPRVTAAERDAIPNPPAGLLIFNTTVNRLEVNVSQSGVPEWQAAATAPPPAPPVLSPTQGDTIRGLALPGALIQVDVQNNGSVEYESTADFEGRFVIPISPSLSNAVVVAVTQILNKQVSPPALVVVGAPGTISALNCASAVFNGTLLAGIPADGRSFLVPYSGGNGGTHNGQTVSSTGVAGLTATLAAGTFVSGNGSLSYTITGTPLSSGTANFVLNIGGQTCTISRAVSAGAISTLNCAGATHTGALVHGVAAREAGSTVPYTGGNGGLYAAQTVNSTGVTGLTATLAAGAFANGSGTLTFTITGTPASSGTASFALNIGGRTCTFTRIVSAGAITALNCSNATHSGTLVISVAAGNATSAVPYTGGNGGSYAAQTINSTGVTGLTATLAAGNFAAGNGSLAFTISGTPASSGTASFALTIGGQTCTFTRTVAAGAITSLNCGSATHNGTLVIGVAASAASSQVPYTGGNGGTYAAQTVSSTGVTGLTASLPAGNFAQGNGSLTYTVTGTPSSSGQASFVLNIGGRTCTLTRNVLLPPGQILTLNCTNALHFGSLQAGIAANNVTTQITYSGGNGGTYDAQTINSTGVTGLIATLNADTLEKGNGSLSLTITGTPSGSGTATFVLTIGGYTCTLNRIIASTCGAFVAPGAWKQFMCYNLGASPSVDPFTPNWELQGDYYQWGRNPSCFGRDGVDASNPCSGAVFGAKGPWGSSANEDNAGSIQNWATAPSNTAPTNAWADGSKSAQDPCPQGFRVPTKTQLEALLNSSLNSYTFVGSWNPSSTNYSAGVLIGPALFLPMAGYRDLNDGRLNFRGSSVFLWSSTSTPSSGSWFVELQRNNSNSGTATGTYGHSVRCIAE